MTDVTCGLADRDAGIAWQMQRTDKQLSKVNVMHHI